MKKTIYLLSFISILSCKKERERDLHTGSTEKKQENQRTVSGKDSLKQKDMITDLKEDSESINSQWAGEYSLSVDYGRLDEFSEMSIDYNLSITKDSCLFSGHGYKTYFADLCFIEGDRNQVAVRYIKEVEGNGMDSHAPTDTLAILFRKGGEYYLKSKIAADRNWKYDTPMLLRKK